MHLCRQFATRLGLIAFLLTLPHRIGAQVQHPGAPEPQAVNGPTTSAPRDDGIHKSLLGFESDIPLTVTTVVLALGTIVLAVANVRLYKITEDHVRHITNLVEVVKDIQASNTLALIQTSVIQEDKKPPSFLFKNVGRVSARLTSASLKIIGSNGIEREFDLPYFTDLWIIPGESAAIQQHLALDSIWRDSVRNIVLSWAFDDGLRPKQIQSARWECDHKRHYINRGA